MTNVKVIEHVVRTGVNIAKIVRKSLVIINKLSRLVNNENVIQKRLR